MIGIKVNPAAFRESPRDRARAAEECVRSLVAASFQPVHDEPHWRPYEPCKEEG